MAKQELNFSFRAALSVVVLTLIGWAGAQGQSGDSMRDKLGRVFGSGDQTPPCPALAYNQDLADLARSTKDMPPKVHDGYKLFRSKCGTCHTLDRPASKSESSPQDWTTMVNRMRDMPSSHMTDAQAATIANYVIWNVDYSNELVRTLMAYDRHGDGKLHKDEVPDRWQEVFDRADANHDGELTPEEIRKYAEAQAGPGVAASAICDPEQRLKK
jgi:mono/diheme cytochrome c family protein